MHLSMLCPTSPHWEHVGICMWMRNIEYVSLHAADSNTLTLQPIDNIGVVHAVSITTLNSFIRHDKLNLQFLRKSENPCGQ